MNNLLFLSITLILLLQMQSIQAQTRYSGTLQTSLTSGNNNGNDETFIGAWLLGRAETGLSRNSLMSFKGKIGARKYDSSNSNLSIIELQGSYLYQPSSGYFSPTYNTTLKASVEDLNSTNKIRNKISIALSRYQPINNKLTLNLSLKLQNQTGNIESDTTSFNANLDYISSIKTTFYFNFNYANEISTTDLTTSTPSNNTSDLAARTYIAAGHLPGEPGYKGPAPSGSTLQADSNISSLSFGAVYTLDAKQFIDLGYIKHFYDNSTSSASSSNYFAIDYFYKF